MTGSYFAGRFPVWGNKADDSIYDAKPDREKLGIALESAGFLRTGEVVREGAVFRRTRDEYAIDVYVGREITLMALDLHIGPIYSYVTAREKGNGWTWYSPSMRFRDEDVDEAGLVSRLVVDGDKGLNKLEEVSAHFFERPEQRQKYLLAKMACTRDARKFMKLLSEVNMDDCYARPLVAGIIVLQGGEIERVAGNWMAGKLLVS